MRHSHAERAERSVISAALIVPMLRVGMQPGTLRVPLGQARKTLRIHHRWTQSVRRGIPTRSVRNDHRQYADRAHAERNDQLWRITLPRAMS